MPSTDWPLSEVLVSHSRQGADWVGLVGSRIPCNPVHRAVSDGMVSRKRVRQVGPREVFAFSANRYCSKPQDLGYGAFLFSCAFMIVSCSLSPGQDPLLVQEREAERE